MKKDKFLCPKCGTTQVKEKLLALDGEVVNADYIGREGYLFNKVGLRPDYTDSSYVLNAGNGVYIKGQFCTLCEIGFVPDLILDDICETKR